MKSVQTLRYIIASEVGIKKILHVEMLYKFSHQYLWSYNRKFK